MLSFSDPLTSSSFFGVVEMLALEELAEPPIGPVDPVFPRVNLKPTMPTTTTTATTPIMTNRRLFVPEEGAGDEVAAVVGVVEVVGVEEVDVLVLGVGEVALNESDRYETALEPLSTTNISPLTES